MQPDECVDVIAALLVRSRREQHAHGGGQRAIGQAIDRFAIRLVLGGGGAEDLFQRQAGLGVDGYGFPHGGDRALRNHRQRQRSALADAGENGLAIAAGAGGALDLLRQRLDVRDHIDAFVFIGLERLQIFPEVDADHGGAFFHQRLGAGLVGARPSVRVGNQEDAGENFAIRHHDVLGGDHASLVSGLFLSKNCGGGKQGGGGKDRFQHAGFSHFPITPLTPPLIRTVASISARAASAPFCTAR
ncbi:hypothetical protein D3C78_1252060 [compost metagenome]